MGHPNTLMTTVSSKASVFDSQGQYDTALKYSERVLAGEGKLLGADHTNTFSHGMARYLLKYHDSMSYV